MKTLLKQLSAMALSAACLLSVNAHADVDIRFNYPDSPVSGNAFLDETPLKDLPTIPALEQGLGAFGINADNCLAAFELEETPAGFDTCLQWAAVQLITNFGENPATTIGEARRNLYEKAVEGWSAALDSDVPIVVQVYGATQEDIDVLFPDEDDFRVDDCRILAYASAQRVYANTRGAIYPNTFYVSALANKLAGYDLQPGVDRDGDGTLDDDAAINSEPFADDISTGLVLSWDNPTELCIEGGRTGGYYYGYNRAPFLGIQVDALSTAEHELGHGLGFARYIYAEDGGDFEVQFAESNVADKKRRLRKFSGAFAQFVHGEAENKQWSQMKPSERIASNVPGNIVWAGPKGQAAGQDFLEPQTLLVVNYQAEPLAPTGFGRGPVPVPENFTNDVVLVDDGSTDSRSGEFGSVNDGCQPLTPESAAAVEGKIAFIIFPFIPADGDDRPTNCPSSQVGANIEAAGAVGLIIANTSGEPASFAGSSLNPNVALNQAQGQAMYDELLAGSPVNVTIDFADSLSGVSENNRILMQVPSQAHFDGTQAPDLLMEPSLTAEQFVDPVTIGVLNDIGWDGELSCAFNSELNSEMGMATTVVVDGCDSGVLNQIGPYQLVRGKRQRSGCTINDVLAACQEGPGTRKCIREVTGELRQAKVLTRREVRQIRRACRRRH